MMKALTIIVTVLGALYSGFWFVASTAADRAANSVVTELRNSGWDVTYTALGVAGFPSRIDTTVTDLSLTDPTGAFGLQAQLIRVFALSYRPNEVIAQLPETMVVTLPGNTLTITSDGLRASASVGVSTDLPLDQVTAETGPLTLTSDLGWATGVTRALAAFRQGGAGPADYDIFVEGEGVVLPAPFRTVIDPTATRPDALSLVRFDAAVMLDRPLDRFAGEAVLLNAVTLRALTIDWGDAGISGTGGFTVLPDGTPDGRVTLTLRNWRALVTVAISAGMITPELAVTVTTMGETLSQGAADLDLPITFQNGLMSLGPIPLGAAPLFR